MISGTKRWRDQERGDHMATGTVRKWACPVISIVLAIVAFALLDWSVWKVLMLGILLACPLTAAWSVIQGNKPLPIPIGPVPETSGSTLDWLAPYYNTVCRVAGINAGFRERTIATAELRHGERVLDIGCGTGVLTRLAADTVGREGEATGIDAAADMIRIARQEAREVGSTARFELAAVERLPFSDRAYDVVFLSFVIHCLPTDVKRIGLSEVWRVLKANGRLVVVDLDRPRNAILRALLWPFTRSLFFGDHLRGRLPEFLKEAGFSSISEAGRWSGLVAVWVACKPAGGAA